MAAIFADIDETMIMQFNDIYASFELNEINRIMPLKCRFYGRVQGPL